MYIPDKIKFNGQVVEVVKKPLAEIDSECNGGWCMWEQNKLIIANDIPESRQAEILLHELLHFGNVYLEEEQVTWITGFIFGVMRENNLNFLETRRDTPGIVRP